MSFDYTGSGARPYQKRPRHPLITKGWSPAQLKFFEDFAKDIRAAIIDELEITGRLLPASGAVTVTNTIDGDKIREFLDTPAGRLALAGTTPATAAASLAIPAASLSAPEPAPPAPPVAPVAPAPPAAADQPALPATHAYGLEKRTFTLPDIAPDGGTPGMVEIFNSAPPELYGALRKIMMLDAPAMVRVPNMRRILTEGPATATNLKDDDS